MATFKDRLFGQHVPKEIIDRFDALQLGKSNAPLESVSKPYSHNLGESTAFARMWTAVDVVTQGQLGPDGEMVKQNTDGDWYYIVKSTGDAAIIPDYDPTEEVHNIQIYSINENREKSYTDNPLDFEFGDGKARYVNQLRHNKLLRGSAGITSITSRTEGALGATIRTVVEFVVHNKRDFDEIILPFFLRPGSNVCVDFGREYTSGGGFNLYDPLKYIANESVDMESFYEQIYKPDKGEMAKNFGSLQVRLGVVDNYDMNINTEGSFVCSLEFMSENTTLIDRNVSPYNNLEYSFSTVLDVVLLNVLSTYQTGKQFINIDDVFNKQELFSGITNDEAVEKELQNFFDKASISAADGTRDTMGVLSKEAILTGIFHQNLSQWDNVWLQSATREEKEKTYITLGRLEDLYLNNFVATVIDPNRFKGGQVNVETPGFTKVPEENYEIQYDSRKGLVRWDQNLFDLQSCVLLPNEELNDFIIPDNWDNSYNTLKGKLTNDVSEDVEESNDEFIGPPAEPEDSTFNETTDLPENEQRDKSNPRFPGIDVMPIREIFISTELIKDSFRNQPNVEKALNSIFRRLNTQSGGIWNIKIISSNAANTQLCFHDANLLSEQTKRLTFDVTSNNSIVSTCNLKFVKSTELSNLISIRSLAEGSYLEDQEGLQSLAHLNSLNSEDNLTFKRIKSLPFRGSANIDNKRAGIDIDPEALKKSIEVAPRSEDITIYSPEGWNSLIAKINSRKLERQKSIDENKGIFGRISYKDPVLSQDGPVNAVGRGNQRGANFGSGGSGQNLVFQNFDGFSKQRIKEEIEKSTEIVASEREVKIKELRKKYMGESTPGSIAPILPLELELTVYGNSYLQPGDLIDINYLPQSYKDKVMFQILEVEQKIEPSNWLTSYLAVMRFEPKYKFIAAGSEKPPITYTTPVKTEEKIIKEKPKEEPKKKEKGKVIVEKDEKGKVIVENNQNGKGEEEEKTVEVFKQPVGTINDLGLVNNSLVFKVFSQQKFPLINDKAGNQTFNHATAQVQDFEKFRDTKNIAYLSAIKSVVFDLIFDKSEINVVFANDIFNEDYNKDNYVKNNVPLQCVIEPFTDEEMKKIFDLHPGEQVDLGKYLNMIPRRYQGDGSTEYADFMKDANVELPKFDGSTETVTVSRFFKRMTFIASDGDENGNPDKMYYFRNQNGLDLLMKKQNPPDVSLAIPESVLQSVGMSYKDFAHEIEEQYNLYLDALKDLGRPRPAVEQQTKPKVFVTYARPAETEAPSNAVIEPPESLSLIRDDNDTMIGPLFLVYRIPKESDGTFRNIIDSRTYYAKTLVTIEVEGKPPSDPILVEAQNRKPAVENLNNSRGILQLLVVDQARELARKEADKRKNS